MEELLLTQNQSYMTVTEDVYTLSVNFQVGEMFTWAQAILDVMLPVIYVTLGIALGFLIVRALKQMFK